ncbi:hypothetical protein DL96DRAFT_1631472 [Flagelloscypha sp. PMI_526]|nr:hypothetical protein DL96DRAFT_1631472 [Flagelloscypha sp. PMI_526]
MNSLGANNYGHAGSSSELVLSYAGESQPPSYSQLPENSAVRSGTYVFRDLPTPTATMTATIIVPIDNSAPPIYNIVTKRLPMPPAHVVIIRKGPPELEGKVLATFEIQGRDMLVIDLKPHVLSKVLTYVKGVSSIPQSFYSSLRNPHRWTRDLTDMKEPKDRHLLCHPGPQNPKFPTKRWARFSLADPMLSVWKPYKYLAEHELEVFPDGAKVMDDCIISLVVLLIAREDVMAKLLTV